jgi:protein YIPF5/7
MSEFMEERDSYTGRVDLKAAFTGTRTGDPPLLNELGIDLELIKSECLVPFKIFQKDFTAGKQSNDLTGSIIILCIFTFSLVLQCKIHFGYIYLVSLVSSFTIFALLNLMSNKTIGYLSCCNIMGYSFSPVVGFSFLNLVSRWLGVKVRLVLGILAGAWSAFSASKVYCSHLEFVNKQAIVIYPLFLTYCCFVMMVIF